MAKKESTIIASAKRTIELEASTLKDLLHSLDGSFEKIVHLILKSKGRLIVTGIGKSGIIANKLVATFISTGQPAVFMHAADAIHGDLGNVQKHDVVICISKSGDSPEIKVLVPLLKSMGNPLIGMVSNKKSFLGLHSDHLLHTPIDREACPNNLAPTTSTTAQLAMGDAIAVALMESRGFTAKDFAKYHPGGALGKKLYTRMGDLLGESANPFVGPNTNMKDVIINMSLARLGATAVVEKDKLVGFITDGDIRRMLEKGKDLKTTKAKDIMNTEPKTMDAESLAVEGFRLMENFNITQMAILKNGKYKGIVHLHDILKEGIF